MLGLPTNTNLILVLSTFADQKPNQIESEEWNEYEENRKNNINERHKLFNTKEINHGFKELGKKQSSKENRRKQKPILNSHAKKRCTRLQTKIDSNILDNKKENSEEMATKGKHLI